MILKTLGGHFSLQVPQELHLERSTTGILLFILMHCCGQFFTHKPHLIQAILQVLETICLIGLRFEQRTMAPF